MGYLRDEIWNAVCDLIDERYQEYICLYEGIKKWEDEIGDIKDSIEELAGAIELDIEDRLDYLMNDAKEDAGCDKNHKEGVK